MGKAVAVFIFVVIVIFMIGYFVLQKAEELPKPNPQTEAWVE
jgi:hypothetical protein